MAAVPKRLYGSDAIAVTTKFTAYTVPAATTAIVKFIRLCNYGTSPVQVTIWVSGVRLANMYTIDSGAVVFFDDLAEVMATGALIEIKAEVANVLAVSVSGVEV